LRRHLKKGLAGEARLIFDWLRETSLEGRTVLDVGGGIGSIQAELIRAGASRGTVVEVATAYEPFARTLAERLDIADRSSFLLADLASDGDPVPDADLVVLRRVVCCSPHGPRLLGAAACRTRGALAASYPRHTIWIRATVWLQDVVFALLRRSFRVFVHDPALLEAEARRAGLHRTRLHRGPVWETALFER
jgi:magnesium-protoporphyrin O-methyltransferase